MSPAQQPASLDRKTQQAMRLVSDVREDWLSTAPTPRALSATRGTLRVPFDGAPVGFESSFERDFLVSCRIEPRIRKVRAQQLQIRYLDHARMTERRYTPDFVVDLQASADVPFTRVVVEVKRLEDLWRSRRDMRAAYAAARVWAWKQPATIFKVVTDLQMNSGWLTNAQLLSPYLDRPHDADLIELIRTKMRSLESARIRELVASVTGRGFSSHRTLAAIYRMMALGELQCDRGLPISSMTWVTFASGRR
ncbi:MAG: Tn7 transposase TnsA N-terminal domain-containing protein [Pseudomonadota bacterium]|uniref:TnsA endonuclease N-terminal domain-containing protein n=1 Tax=unclassified Phenylobacterium TaxID=2640670 RepID=UPI0012277A27|nr:MULTISPECIES: TnsA endonuclease N-terminal domain-containing protein [unclassified Phenylobacterium]TAJ69288.1 MAG: hypothetical protein EPO51_23830 [Phenylobacterium sp.]